MVRVDSITGTFFEIFFVNIGKFKFEFWLLIGASLNSWLARHSNAAQALASPLERTAVSARPAVWEQPVRDSAARGRWPDSR
jgi:hypothetical protein